MAVQLIGLPQLQYPQNAMLDFGPLTQSLAGYRQGMNQAEQWPLQRNALLAQTDLARQHAAVFAAQADAARQQAELRRNILFGDGAAPAVGPGTSTPASQPEMPAASIPNVPGIVLDNAPTGLGGVGRWGATGFGTTLPGAVTWDSDRIAPSPAVARAPLMRVPGVSVTDESGAEVPTVAPAFPSRDEQQAAGASWLQSLNLPARLFGGGSAPPARATPQPAVSAPAPLTAPILPPPAAAQPTPASAAQPTVVAPNGQRMTLDQARLLAQRLDIAGLRNEPFEKAIAEAAAEQRPTESTRTAALRTDEAYRALTGALQSYRQLITEGGVSILPGTQYADAVAQTRTNIMLQLKELYNLGVLNGPDFMLMQRMLPDPGVGIEGTGPLGAVPTPYGLTNLVPGTAGARTAAAVDRLMELLRDKRNAAMATVGGSPVARTPPIDEQPPMAGARRAPDGNWYVPDPQRPGQYLRVDR